MPGAAKARKKQKNIETTQQEFDRLFRDLYDEDLINLMDRHNKDLNPDDHMYMPVSTMINMQMLRELRRIGRDG